MQASNPIPKVFISAPISLDWSTVWSFGATAHKTCDVFHWDRTSEYDQNLFDSCDTVIFLLPNNRFESRHIDLPTGLKSELRRAYEQSKNILLGYKNLFGEHQFFETETNGQYIKAIPGTEGALKRIVEKTEKKCQGFDWVGKKIRAFDYSKEYLSNMWNDRIKNFVGQIGKVVKYNTDDNSIKVEFGAFGEFVFWYPADLAKEHIVDENGAILAAWKMASPSIYGVDNSNRRVYVPNPWAEIELPKVIKLPSKEIGSIGHPGKMGVDGDPFDERLILML